MKNQHDIIVIGAGIIGLSAALELQRAGRAVTVVDRMGVAAEASAGNAGGFALSHIEPLATPGVMRNAPKWLLDPLGPLSIPPSYLLKIAPWMLRFWRASWQDRYVASLHAQADLMRLSQAALERQIRFLKAESLIRREGQLALYEGEKQYKASLDVWKLCQQYDIEYTLLQSPEAIAEIQQGISPRFTHAAFTPNWLNCCDPEIWTNNIAKKFKSLGGVIDILQVQSLAQQPDKICLSTSIGELTANQVVVAAGAWSHHLAQTFGDKIPLETERGYNTTLPTGAFGLKTHLTFGGHGFVVSKIGDGVRIGGAVELGGLTLPPDYKRSEFLLQKAADFLPELKTEGGKQWMGFRPSLPDSLPVIDHSPKNSNIIYAFGHGHLGLTQAAGTAELVSSLVNKTKPNMPLTAFSATRF